MLSSVVKQLLLLFRIRHNIIPYLNNKIIMRTPTTPQQLLQTFLIFNHKDISCIEENANIDTLRKSSKKDTLKEEIKVLQQQKFEYLNLLEHKKELTQTLKELLNYRQSIEYDHRYKRIKFEHYQFPYRDNTKIKEELYQQREKNREKRKKIKELEEEIKIQQRNVEKKRLDKENLDIWKIGNFGGTERNRDCQEDYWLKRIEKMKTLYMNHDSQWKRAKIKHDYNLMVQKNRCCCPSTKVCAICSDLNVLQTSSVPPQTQGYARQALLSPRYTSIYRQKKIF